MEQSPGPSASPADLSGKPLSIDMLRKLWLLRLLMPVRVALRGDNKMKMDNLIPKTDVLLDIYMASCWAKPTCTAAPKPAMNRETEQEEDIVVAANNFPQESLTFQRTQEPYKVLCQDAEVLDLHPRQRKITIPGRRLPCKPPPLHRFTNLHLINMNVPYNQMFPQSPDFYHYMKTSARLWTPSFAVLTLKNYNWSKKLSKTWNVWDSVI
ncbi:hypothetical protein SK128_026537 [Halocaridina rubra]|uniref:Uncharacterized protein n=1 Tax=Halocaridina rubra TaxID=373956 RepID=A0AAN8WS28_HALRR